MQPTRGRSGDYGQLDTQIPIADDEARRDSLASHEKCLRVLRSHQLLNLSTAALSLVLMLVTSG